MDKGHSDQNTAGLSQAHLLICAAVLILVWGTAFTMLDVAVRHVTPIWTVVYRSALAALIVTIYALLRGKRFPALNDQRWLWYFGMGFIGMVFPFYLTGLAQTKIDSGLAAILVGTMPLLTIGLAHFFANEYLSVRKGIGFLLGFIGTVILFLPDELGLDLVGNWQFQLFAVGAAFCYAVTTIIAKRAPDTPSEIGAAMMLIGATLASFVWAAITGFPTEVPPVEAILNIIGLGLGSSAIGTILYLFVIDRRGPTTLAKINYFPPFASVTAGIILLNEAFTSKIAIAFALIMIGVWIARESTKASVPIKPSIPSEGR